MILISKNVRLKYKEEFLFFLFFNCNNFYVNNIKKKNNCSARGVVSVVAPNN